MSYIQRVLYRRKGGCDDTHSVAVMSYMMEVDVMLDIVDLTS